jgi:quercetin dioxygenase-like cupin family protein
MHIRTSLSRPTKVAPADHFTGQVFLDEFVTSQGPSRLNATAVTFTPGARTAWHKHGFRQVLIATVGHGFVQVEGEPARELNPGDVAIVPPDTVHWHGAANDSLFTHLALLESEGRGTAWLPPVTDDDYRTATVERQGEVEFAGLPIAMDGLRGAS